MTQARTQQELSEPNKKSLVSIEITKIDPHHHLAATHLRQAQLGGPGRLLLRHAPTQLHLLQVEAVRGGAAPELREHGAHQDVALRMHVSEGGGDEDAYASPPDDGGEEWVVK